jgi:hypothetical protein
MSTIIKMKPDGNLRCSVMNYDLATGLGVRVIVFNAIFNNISAIPWQ